MRCGRRGQASRRRAYCAAMRVRLAGSIAGVLFVSVACTAPLPEPDRSQPPAAAGSPVAAASASPPAPRLTYNPAQWPDPLDNQWLGGKWLLIAAAPAPRIKPLRYHLDFASDPIVTDEAGKPLTWVGKLESVEWSDPRGSWTVQLSATERCARATYSVTIKNGLLFAPLQESCRDRFGILVVDAWIRQQPAATPAPASGG